MGRPLPPLLDGALQEPRVEPFLQRVIAQRFGAGSAVQKVSASVVQRRVVRYAIAAVRPGAPEPFACHVIGKVYDGPAAGPEELEALQRLRERGFAAARPPSIGVPEAYAYVPELQMLLMQDVGGTPLRQLVKQRRARPAHMRRFARALVKLHRFPPILADPYTIDDHLAQRCAGQCGPLGAAFPELAPAIGEIVATAREWQCGERALAHGDWHLGQLHVDGHASWILDFEQLRWGDPAHDVALAVMQLARLAREGGRAAEARALRDAFLATYFTTMGLDCAARLPLNVALALLKRACKRFRWQDQDGWPDTVRAQIRQATEWVRLQRALPPPRCLADVIAMCDSCAATA
jgi:Ser/Thr protein kinase RdoA (MazF antagonist)